MAQTKFLLLSLSDSHLASSSSITLPQSSYSTVLSRLEFICFPITLSLSFFFVNSCLPFLLISSPACHMVVLAQWFHLPLSRLLLPAFSASIDSQSLTLSAALRSPICCFTFGLFFLLLPLLCYLRCNTSPYFFMVMCKQD